MPTFTGTESEVALEHITGSGGIYSRDRPAHEFSGRESEVALEHLTGSGGIYGRDKALMAVSDVEIVVGDYGPLYQRTIQIGKLKCRIEQFCDPGPETTATKIRIGSIFDRRRL